MNKATGLNRKQTVLREEAGMRIWCGAKEGFLTLKEIDERTAAGVEAYAKMKPLRYRTAMAARDQVGARIYCRTPLWSIQAQ